MPTARIAIDHIGLTVPDLDRAVAFFSDVFGCELVFYTGPYDDVGFVWPGDSESEKLSLRIAVLTHNGTNNIELLEYTNRTVAPTSTVAPRPADPGGMHLAFYVDDIYQFEQQLQDRSDVRFLTPVTVEEGTPIAGTDWAYLLTDWGLTIELIRWQPGTLPYEQTTHRRMIPPTWLSASS
jgi:catechol 2,3-dioxygenase-like lactoylglutathione lyase family enzyme